MGKKNNTCEDGCCNCKTKVALAVVGIILVAVLVMVSYTAGTSTAKDSKEIVVSTSGVLPEVKTLSVSGTVSKMVAPDKVDIVLSVSTLDRSAQKSQSDNAITAEKVTNALKGLSSVKAEVKTVSYSVNEEFEWNESISKFESKGYRTINQIQVTLKGTDVSGAGKVIDVAVGAGANSVSSISFGLTDAKEMDIRKQALNEASTVAKTKADSIASGLGIVLGKVHMVSESSFYYTPNYRAMNDVAFSSSAENARTPINAGDVEVSSSVSVSFEIK